MGGKLGFNKSFFFYLYRWVIKSWKPGAVLRLSGEPGADKIPVSESEQSNDTTSCGAESISSRRSQWPFSTA